MNEKFSALSSRKIERDTAKEGIPQHFDALVVLGKNWKEPPPFPQENRDDFKPRLSMESKMSALGAGEMLKQGLIDRIIFSGGKTAGEDYPSEAAAMAAYLREKYPDIPDEMIGLEEESIDTIDNAERIARVLEAHPELQKLALMTVGFHVARSERIFKDRGIDAYPFPAEEVLKQRSPHYERFLNTYEKSGRVTKEKIKELILQSLLYIDPKGGLPRTFTKKRGAE